MALDDRHPDAERLAEYADGVLDVEARTAVEQHLADCADCRSVVMETMAFMATDPELTKDLPSPGVVPFRSRRWVTAVAIGLAAAAALVLAIRVARPGWVSGLFGPRGERPELQELIAAVAHEPTRPVEGRLTGGFTYAPPPSPTRGKGPGLSFSSGSIDAIQNTKDRHQSKSDARSRGAFGVASLFLGNLDEAVAALEEAVRTQPSSAQFQTNLSAAYLERARFGAHPTDLQNALQAAERAIAQTPTQQEAVFNRALALERLGRPGDALKAWEEYHRTDPRSRWGEEAAKHALSLMGMSDANPEAVYRSVTELATQRAQQPPWDPTILVNGGFTSSDYPASYWASLNEHGCSATYVGPRVVLTAAHCLAFDHAKIWLGRLGQSPLTGRCDRSPNYVSNEPSGLPVDDWALCKMDEDSSVPAEVVNIDPTVVHADTGLIVTGYGCDLTNGRRTIGVSFEIGYMKVQDPNRNGQGLIWAIPESGTTLCDGDSGGGTFTPLPDGRVEVASNSTSDRISASTMSNLSSDGGRKFLYTWSRCHQLPICGLDKNLGTPACRMGMPSGNSAYLPATYSCPAAWSQP